MKILSFSPTITSSVFNNNPAKSTSFGTSSREYENDRFTKIDGNIVRTSTWMYRHDINWRGLLKFINRNFENKGKIHIYSLAGSDGSEAYTLAMEIKEKLPKEAQKKMLPIIVSDRDSEIIQKAKNYLINLKDDDIKSIEREKVAFENYFTKADDRLEIKDDKSFSETKTYEVSDYLKKAVKFEENEKNDVISRIKKIYDNSNTVLLCRNVTPYMAEDEVFDLARTASNYLKKGSLFITGNFDNNTEIKYHLNKLGFEQVMPNVFQKTK